jgi:hypothetical protein
MTLLAKKLWRDDKAADVMGPVDSGDRMRAKNGVSIVGSGMLSISLSF